jgi:hypothetical protein
MQLMYEPLQVSFTGWLPGRLGDRRSCRQAKGELFLRYTFPLWLHTFLTQGQRVYIDSLEALMRLT